MLIATMLVFIAGWSILFWWNELMDSCADVTEQELIDLTYKIQLQLARQRMLDERDVLSK